MTCRPAIFLSGTAPDSVGAALLHTLYDKCQETPIVAFDRQDNPLLSGCQNARQIIVDLNPLASSESHERLQGRLESEIHRVRDDLGFSGIETVILAAGVYEFGRLAESTIEARKRLVGVNVCGKIEFLHSVLRANQTLGHDSSEALTLIDVGSLHGLAASGERSLYAATKAFGLDLTLSLSHGREVRRAIHLAPGPIDTPMLHRNHWVSKERGPSKFFDDVRTQGGTLYEDVFVRCDDAAFAEAKLSSQTHSAELDDIFARYKNRRAAQFDDAKGVLRPADVAHQIVEILTDESTYSDGVYILTAPSGEVRMKQVKFTDVLRHNPEP